MDGFRWVDTHRALAARIAASMVIVVVLLSFLPGPGGGPLFDANITTAKILDWVRQSPGAIAFTGFHIALNMMLFAAFMILLAAVCRARGLFLVAVAGSMFAGVAVDWVNAGVYFALADAGHRAGADAGVLALFSLAKMMTFTDGFLAGVALVALCLAAMRSRTMPAPLVWLGLIVGAYHLVGLPIQFALTHTADGITGPIDVALTFLWFLAAAIVLLIKPVRAAKTDVPEPASVA